MIVFYVNNSTSKRAFITTQSIRKLKTHLNQWCHDHQGWRADGYDTVFDISSLKAKKLSLKSIKPSLF